jgi:hypothetical protein
MTLAARETEGSEDRPAGPVMDNRTGLQVTTY